MQPSLGEDERDGVLGFEHGQSLSSIRIGGGPNIIASLLSIIQFIGIFWVIDRRCMYIIFGSGQAVHIHRYLRLDIKPSVSASGLQ